MQYVNSSEATDGISTELDSDVEEFRELLARIALERSRASSQPLLLLLTLTLLFFLTVAASWQMVAAFLRSRHIPLYRHGDGLEGKPRVLCGI